MTELAPPVAAVARLAADNLLTDASAAAVAAAARAHPSAPAEKLYAAGLRAADRDKWVATFGGSKVSATAERTLLETYRLDRYRDLRTTAADYKAHANADLFTLPEASVSDVHNAATEWAKARDQERREKAKARPSSSLPAAPAALPPTTPQPVIPASATVDDLVGKAVLLRLAGSPTASLMSGFLAAAREIAEADPTLTPEAVVGRAIEHERADAEAVADAITRSRLSTIEQGHQRSARH